MAVAVAGCGLGTVAFEGDQAADISDQGDDTATVDGAAPPPGETLADASGACPAPSTRCPLANGGDACIDLRTSEDHCGACSHPCSVGGCVDGECQRVVFQTTQGVTGAFGGLAAADQACNASARTNPALRGTFKAWLSTSTIAVSTRMTRGTRPYVLPDGAVVAPEFASFAEKPHLLPIAVSATNVPIGKDVPDDQNSVWTGTSDGGSPSGVDCEGWTQLNPVNTKGATVGNPNATDERWTNASSAPCGSTFRFYCVEQ